MKEKSIKNGPTSKWTSILSSSLAVGSNEISRKKKRKETVSVVCPSPDCDTFPQEKKYIIFKIINLLLKRDNVHSMRGGSKHSFHI